MYVLYFICGSDFFYSSNYLALSLLFADILFTIVLSPSLSGQVAEISLFVEIEGGETGFLNSSALSHLNRSI